MQTKCHVDDQNEARSLAMAFAMADIEDVLGADAMAAVEAALEKAFIISRQSTDPRAKQMLQTFLTAMLAAVIAAPDNIAGADRTAQESAAMLVDLVREMLVQYAQP